MEKLCQQLERDRPDTRDVGDRTLPAVGTIRFLSNQCLFNRFGKIRILHDSPKKYAVCTLPRKLTTHMCRTWD